MGIFDFFKRAKKEPENNSEEIQVLEMPDFTKINLDELEDYYDWTLKYGSRKIIHKTNIRFEPTFAASAPFSES